MSVLEESRPFAQQLSNVYFTILSLFCFKLFVKISLAILSHFYIVKGNRKEAARIAAEFYGASPAQGRRAGRGRSARGARGRGARPRGLEAPLRRRRAERGEGRDLCRRGGWKHSFQGTLFY